MTVRLNQTDIAVPQDWLEEPLLWFLRDHAGLRATRFGCGVGVCGACVVHGADRATRASVQAAVPQCYHSGERSKGRINPCRLVETIHFL
ncbi:MAG: 2Fe-2S iron-sulfur cluster-binding protein [Alphaproteobacteria bacterium]|nr:2Fe-2S iron-sulfur cluster-binding protein [Alphaproteobacteria bacterium]